MFEFQIEDFLPSYPQYKKDPEFPILDVYEDDMYDVIRRKKEFSELTQSTESDDVITNKTYLNHQLLIQRLLSGNTPYNAMLLWHEVGTGKTISSISVAEAMQRFTDKRALVLVKGKTIADNFKQEIVKINPLYNLDENGEEIYPIDQQLPEDSIKKRKLNASIYKSYDINTFRVFCKSISVKMKRSRELVKQEFSNRVIIIDEVHNLREEEEKENRQKKDTADEKIYTTLHTFLHLVENCKIILLTATPMKDDVSEFASIMNLILPLSEQFTIAVFKSYFETGTIEPDKKEIIMNRVKGYVSYLRQNRVDINVINQGEFYQQLGQPRINGFKLVPLEMELEQSTIYYKAYLQDRNYRRQNSRVERDQEGIWEDTRQAILSCFPIYKSTEYGNGGQVSINQYKVIRFEAFYKTLAKLIIPDKNDNGNPPNVEEKLAYVKKYSIKYHYIISHLMDSTNNNRKMFVYSKFIEGSGIFLLAALLDRFGVSEAKLGSLTTRQKRYTLLTSHNQNEIQSLLKRFNQKDNKEGHFIQIVLGSGTIGEGQSLKCVRDVFILTPHWNYTETEQAIGRAVRFRSHEVLPEDQRSVSIHRLLALPNLSSLEKQVMATQSGNTVILEEKAELKIQLVNEQFVRIQDSNGTKTTGTYYTKDRRIVCKTDVVFDISKPLGITPDNISVDYRMYQRSYDKDLHIKQVESIAQEIAIDCTMNQPRNQLGPEYNNTRECFYKPCVYTCSVPLSVNPPLEDTYNLFYTEKEYSELCHYIQVLFQTEPEFSYSFEKLCDYFFKIGIAYPVHVILRCLNDIIENKEEFRNPNGFVSYLTEKYNIYYLTTHLFSIHDDHLYDAIHGPFYPKVDIKKYLDHIEFESVEEIIEHMRINKSIAFSIVVSLQDSLKELLFRAFIQKSYEDLEALPEKKEFVNSIIKYGIKTNYIKEYYPRDRSNAMYYRLHTNEVYKQTASGWKWEKLDEPELEEEKRNMSYIIQAVSLALIKNKSLVGYGIIEINNETEHVDELEIFKCSWFGDQSHLQYMLAGKNKGINCKTMTNAETMYVELMNKVYDKQVQKPPKKADTCLLLREALQKIYPFQDILFHNEEDLLYRQSLVFTEEFHSLIKKWIDDNINEVFRAALESDQIKDMFTDRKFDKKLNSKIDDWLDKNLEKALQITREVKATTLRDHDQTDINNVEKLIASRLELAHKKNTKKQLQEKKVEEELQTQGVGAQGISRPVEPLESKSDVVMVTLKPEKKGKKGKK